MELTVGISVPRTSREALGTAFLGIEVMPFSVPTTHPIFLRSVSTEEILKLVFTVEELVWVLQGSLASLKQQSSQRFTLEGQTTGQYFWLDLVLNIEAAPEAKCPRCEVWRRMAQSLENDQQSSLDPGFLSDLEAFPLANIAASLPVALTEQDRAHLKTTLIHANEQEKLAQMLQDEVKRLNALVKDLLKRPVELPHEEEPCCRCEELMREKGQLERELATLKIELREEKHRVAEIEAMNQVLSAECSIRTAQHTNASALSAELQQCRNLLSISEDQRMTLLRDMTKAQGAWKERIADLQSELKKSNAEKEQGLEEARRLEEELNKAREDAQKAQEQRIEEEARKLERKAQDVPVMPTSKKSDQILAFESHLSEKLSDLARANESLLQDKSQLQSALDILEDQLRERENEVQHLKREIQHSEGDRLTREDLNLLKSQIGAYGEVSKALRSQLNTELPQLVKMLSSAGRASATEVDGLKQTLAAQQKELNELRSMLYRPTPEYIPLSDDPVDMTLAAYLNNRRGGMPVPFQRKEPGVYMFGTKRVFIRIENGKVIIRVGGGYMNIEEFLAIYTPMEIGRVMQESVQSPQQLEEKLTSQLDDKNFTTCIGIKKRNLSLRKS